MGDRSAVFDRARLMLGLSHDELWLRYFALGGMSGAIDVEAFVSGILEPSTHDHDLLAHALNERFTAIGLNHPLPYLADNISISGADTAPPVNRVDELTRNGDAESSDPLDDEPELTGEP
jgi:hypothetical protein